MFHTKIVFLFCVFFSHAYLSTICPNTFRMIRRKKNWIVLDPKMKSETNKLSHNIGVCHNLEQFWQMNLATSFFIIGVILAFFYLYELSNILYQRPNIVLLQKHLTELRHWENRKIFALKSKRNFWQLENFDWG